MYYVIWKKPLWRELIKMFLFVIVINHFISGYLDCFSTLGQQQNVIQGLEVVKGLYAVRKTDMQKKKTECGHSYEDNIPVCLPLLWERERASELLQTGCILISKTVGFALPCSKGHLVFHPCLIRRMSEMTIEQTWWHCFNRTVLFYTIVRSVVFKKRGIVRIHSDLASTLPTSRPLPYPSAFQKLGAQTGISNINTCHVLYTGTALKTNLSAFLPQRRLHSDLHEDKSNFIIIIIIVDVLSSCL